MVRNKKLGLILLILLLFAGCVEMPPAPTIPPAPTPPEPVVPLKPPAPNAQLTVASDPASASLFLLEASRSIKSGQTIELEPGNYTITAYEPNYKRERIEVSLQPGEARTVFIKLNTIMGKLRVETEPPGADISIGGVSKGVSPLTLDLARGEYSVSAALPNYISMTQKHSVERQGEQLQVLKIELKPKPIGLKVETEPSGADVFVNNKLAGMTPLDTKLDVGVYEVEVKARGLSHPKAAGAHGAGGMRTTAFLLSSSP